MSTTDERRFDPPSPIADDSVDSQDTEEPAAEDPMEHNRRLRRAGRRHVLRLQVLERTRRPRPRPAFMADLAW